MILFLFSQKDKASDESENIVTKLKEEGIEDDTLSVQEIERITQLLMIQILLIEHKLETDYQ